MLSMKFTAFVTATTHRTVTATSAHAVPKTPAPTPTCHSATAASASYARRTSGETPRTSSNSPTMASTAAPAST